MRLKFPGANSMGCRLGLASQFSESFLGWTLRAWERHSPEFFYCVNERCQPDSGWGPLEVLRTSEDFPDSCCHQSKSPSRMQASIFLGSSKDFGFWVGSFSSLFQQGSGAHL